MWTINDVFSSIVECDINRCSIYGHMLSGSGTSKNQTQPNNIRENRIRDDVTIPASLLHPKMAYTLYPKDTLSPHAPP
jgi:hypothetical protein